MNDKMKGGEWDGNSTKQDKYQDYIIKE
jgi:hypothetical protein